MLKDIFLFVQVYIMYKKISAIDFLTNRIVTFPKITLKTYPSGRKIKYSWLSYNLKDNS